MPKIAPPTTETERTRDTSVSWTFVSQNTVVNIVDEDTLDTHDAKHNHLDECSKIPSYIKKL